MTPVQILHNPLTHFHIYTYKSLNQDLAMTLGPPVTQGPALFPPRTPLHGQTTSILPLDSAHAASLFTHLGGERNYPRWTYMYTSGFPSASDSVSFVEESKDAADRIYYAVTTSPGTDAEVAGLLAYLAVVEDHMRIEIGSVIFGEALQRSKQATEAFYLFIKHAFEDLGYRRVEWKANKLNSPSLTAAERLGFVYEGVFRNHMVLKGRSRDTAWFSITDDEWPTVKKGFEAWLDSGNFDKDGNQIRSLKECRSQ